MSEAIGIRLDENILKKIDFLGRLEALDRSMVIRKLINVGFREMMREKAAQKYIEGKISFTQAAHKAYMTLWDFQHYLVDKGFRSSYSIEDMEEELDLLKVRKK